MYIKTGPAWSSIKKAYIKTGSVWKKIFDTTSSAPYSTEVPTIRVDAYTGTIKSASSISLYDPTGESRVGIKLYGRENPSSWQNGPFTSQKYQWWISNFANGQDGYMIKETTDTFYSLSSELDDYYDGMYLFFRAIYTNTANKTGTANSLPVYLHKNSPSKYTASGGWSTNGITSTLTQTGTAIRFNYAWKNEYYRSIDRWDSVIEWYRGYPANDKSNLIQSTEFIYTTNEIDDDTEYSGYDEYVPVVADVGSYIYVKTTVTNSYTKSPMYGSPIEDIYSTASAVSARPTIVTMPSITKLDNYQTIGYSLRGNTGVYNITPTRVYWGFQYASSATTPNLQWRTFQTRSVNPITYTYNYTSYFGNETSQNQNHDFLMPDKIWDAGLDLEIPLAGKYLRFYSIADGAGTQSDTYYSEVIGPIYSRVTKPGNPILSYTGQYSSGYSIVSAYWSDASVFKTYKLQYSSDGEATWNDLATTTESTNPGGAYFAPVTGIVPTGILKYRVRNINEDGQYSDSNVVSFTTNADYTFSLGNTLYVGTNGYIGVDEGGSYSSLPSTGRFLSFFTRDLVQSSLRYWSNSTDFTILWDGYVYGYVGQSAYRVTYEAHFYSTYVDFKFINFGSSVGVPSYPIGMYQSGSAINAVAGPYGYFANASYRVFYGPQTGSTSPSGFTNVVSANMVSNTTNNGQDDTYTTITTSQNMYEAPTWTQGTTSSTSNSITADFSTNSSYSKYKYVVRYDNSSGSVAYESDNYETSKPLSISPLVGATTYWISVTPYNSYNQAGSATSFTYSTMSAPGAFNIISAEKEMIELYNNKRPVYVQWGKSENATLYEVQVQGSDNGITWSDVTTFAQSPYINSNDFAGSQIDNSKQSYQTYRYKTMEFYPSSTSASLKGYIKNYRSLANSYEVPTIYSSGMSLLFSSGSGYVLYPTDRWLELRTFSTNFSYSIYSQGTFLMQGPRLQSNYKYYRVAVRSSTAGNPGVYTYNNGGTLSSPVYVEAQGYGPLYSPSIAVSPTSDGASLSWSAPAIYDSLESGSANVSGVQFSSDNVNWGTTKTSPHSITGLAAGSTYTYYARYINADDLVSSSASFNITPAADPVNSSLPTITTNNATSSVFAAGNVITIGTGTWSNAASYKYELFYGGDTPISVTSTAAKTLVNTNQYVITNADATNVSYYFRAKVTAYKGANQTGTSVVAWSPTSAQSIIVPSTTLSVGTATTKGFTISGTSSNISSNVAYATIKEIRIYDSNQSLINTYNSSNLTMPVIDGTDGTWSYKWEGGSKSTDYYVKVDIRSTDTAGTTVTTPFSSKITTSSGPSNTAAPTITTNNATNTVFQAGNTITINAGTWSGASSYKYELFFGNDTNINQTYSSKALTNTNQYAITNSDAYGEGVAVSYYFRGRVTAYSGANQTGDASDPVWTTVSAQSILNPSTSIAVSGAGTTGFTISGTATPNVSGTAYTSVTKIEIFNSAQTSVASITSGLPTVNGSTGAWSYVWTGGAAETQYYAKATVTAKDDAGTTFTTGFSTAITTTSSFTAPNPGVPPSFLFSRNLNGGTSTTRRNWFWNVSSGMGSYTYVIYELAFYNQTAQPSPSASPTSVSTFGTSSSSAPVSNANNYNFSSTGTPSYRTMARGSSYAGSNGTTIPTGTAFTWGKARCIVRGTNGSDYTGSYTNYA